MPKLQHIIDRVLVGVREGRRYTLTSLPSFRGAEGGYPGFFTARMPLPVFELLIQKAVQEGVLLQLLPSDHQTFEGDFLDCLFKGPANVLAMLRRALVIFRSREALSQLPRKRALLASLRKAYFMYPDCQNELDELCQLLRAAMPPEKFQANPFDHADAKLADVYAYFFKTEPPAFPLKSKQEAITITIAWTAKILCNRERSHHYLRRLNALFDGFCKTQGIHCDVDARWFEFVTVDRRQYPCLKRDGDVSQLPKMYSILQRFLIAFLRMHGVDGPIEQWLGYVSRSKASAQVAGSAIVFENRYGPGLFHGKFSHVLQWCIIILAMDECSPVIGKYALSFPELLKALVETKMSDMTAWDRVLDMYVYGSCPINFTEPHALFTYIMQSKETLGALASALIIGFLKGLSAYSDVLHQEFGFPNMTQRQLLAKWGDMYLGHFYSTDEVEFYLKHVWFPKSCDDTRVLRASRMRVCGFDKGAIVFFKPPSSLENDIALVRSLNLEVFARATAHA